MANLYADRMFLSCNSFELIDVQSVQVSHNRNARAVQTMTRDKRNKGWVEGNLDIEITAVIAIQNQIAQPAFAGIDYQANNISLTIEFGANQLVYTGVMLKSDAPGAGAAGDEVKNTFVFGALDVKDPVGLVTDTLDIQLA